MSNWAKKLWLGLAVFAMLVLPVPNIAFALVVPSQAGEASDVLQAVADGASAYKDDISECETDNIGHAEHSQGDCCGAVSGLVNVEIALVDFTHRHARNTSFNPGMLRDVIAQLFRPPSLA